MKSNLNKTFNQKELADFYDELPLWSAPFGLKLLELINYRRNINALDIGFGAGFPLIEVSMRLGSTSKIFGIDPWEEAQERVQKKLYYFGINNVIPLRGEAESIPLEDNSIDLIISNNGINNVHDLNVVFNECARIMKPGGQFVMTMNLIDTMIEFYSILEQTFVNLGLTGYLRNISNHIYEKRKPIKEVINILDQNGFAVKDQVIDKFTYGFATGEALFSHSFIRIAFLKAWQSIMPPFKTDEIFKILEARFDELADMGKPIVLTVPFVALNCRKF